AVDRLACDRDGVMWLADKLDGAALIPFARAAAEGDAAGRDLDRAQARVDAGTQEDCPAEAVLQRQASDLIEGGLDRGGVIAARRRDRLLDRHGRQGDTAAQVARVREVHDPVARRRRLVNELAV